MYRVLLADDEQIERMALAKRLKRHFGGSLDISEAVNGAEALETFRREKSQIVVMDISMPEMNGGCQIRGWTSFRFLEARPAPPASPPESGQSAL